MGRNGKQLHGNGREWECKKPFPAISSMDAFMSMLLLLITCEQLTQILEMFDAMKTALAVAI